MDEMKITREVYDAIVENLSTRTTECGGVLGAGADGIVSEFYFDATGQSNPNGYAPDVNAINKMLINDWMPHSILMVGIVHSHVNSLQQQRPRRPRHRLFRQQCPRRPQHRLFRQQRLHRPQFLSAW